jgi:hypothetical protein
MERRAHERLKLAEGAYTVKNSASAEELGTVLDASLGGLAFIYSQNGSPPQESSELDIASADTKLNIRQLPYYNVNDFEYSNGYPFEIQRRRRRGIRFHDLTAKQLEQIKRMLLRGTQ